ncbi:MAG: NADH:flavin oxidoreductase [Verrucomicrobia bacterium]|nr:NADH:flavin oxidoreductase [Verrucomicrobiota bacterium]MCG2681911.1 NADH:flavin oxidoreductase [Kiritimatiellia bacterium]MBU4246751.1 NADH:flavin oxidoreductase [Verrucomicrobiota bacterium]MBU4291172.1 NADH:flavin oxidoreductase [Verrucomicrobiota bacterium]MBU4428942.1 NADH:flavin oxidoreductase [Verrucomicrobiota bacterium]
MKMIFDPLTIKNLVLSSRLVRSATAERLAMENPEDGEQMGATYAALARGGVGLIITGHIAVHPAGRLDPLMAGLYSDQQVEAWRQAVALTHVAGGLLVAQLNHGGGRSRPVGDAPVCVSCLPDRPHDPMQGAPLDFAMIEMLISAFAQTARLAQDVGMNGVQIHAAHGYLGSQFLSPATNQRSDEWGGSIENRSRFLRRVVQSVRAAVGANFPVGMKLGACDDDPAGLRIEDALRAVTWFQEDGLDFIEISGAFRSDICRRKVKPGVSEGYYVPLARQFKETLSIPVIAVGGFRSLGMMNEAIGSGACDAISMARPLIRRPDILNVLKQGGASDCLSCNLCLLHNEPRTQCHAVNRISGKSRVKGGAK